MSISSMALSITGIDDRRYWNFIPNDESRCFHLLVNLTCQFLVIMFHCLCMWLLICIYYLAL
jgi:hypothetical protein